MTTSNLVKDKVSADDGSAELAVDSIRLTHLLSFGDGISDDLQGTLGGWLNLRPLNILVGPNGVGKSNLLDAFALLHSSATGVFAQHIAEGGGISEWIWKGLAEPSKAQIDVLLPYYPRDLYYTLSFAGDILDRPNRQDVEVRHEDLSDRPTGYGGKEPINFYLENYRNITGAATFRVSAYVEEGQAGRTTRERRWISSSTESVQETGLSKVSGASPEADHVRKLFSSFRFYRDWHMGRSAILRDLQEMSLAGDGALREDARNLAEFLHALPAKEHQLAQEYLREFYGNDAHDYRIDIMRDRRVGLSLEERGFRTPAKRMSDGTLRWLALLAVLLNPSPPPLVCLEEPEMGLHPDTVPVLAFLLEEASKRTQLIVTTHSDVLVDYFTHAPENIVVCDKVEGATRMRRLSTDELRTWLDRDYSLAEIWSSGYIGGNP